MLAKTNQSRRPESNRKMCQTVCLLLVDTNNEHEPRLNIR